MNGAAKWIIAILSLGLTVASGVIVWGFNVGHRVAVVETKLDHHEDLEVHPTATIRMRSIEEKLTILTERVGELRDEVHGRH